ncbi:MAG: NAD(P)H-hydrate epimerase [Gemmatimonadaceae bacterium]
MIRVVTAGQASAADAAAIASGTASFNLMASAGTHAAALIEARWRDRLRGVLVVAGSGNNGGDGYVVADALRRSGAGVHLLAFGAPRTADAQRAASEAHAVSRERPAGAGEPTLVVDAVLGTGSSGPPRGDAMAGIAEVRQWRARGVPVIALDLPSGLDATTGEADGVVPADWTITFGHVKRGLLIARGTCGRITAVDIGLGRHGEDIAGSLELVDEAWVAARIPLIAAEAYKGSRRRVAIVGGDVGMAGAPILAARGAMRSGGAWCACWWKRAACPSYRLAPRRQRQSAGRWTTPPSLSPSAHTPRRS